MPYKLRDSVRDKFKKQTYNKRDWNAYDEGLKNRGSLTIWFSEDVISGWNHRLCCIKEFRDELGYFCWKDYADFLALGMPSCAIRFRI
jgi:hypothetical protein